MTQFTDLRDKEEAKFLTFWSALSIKTRMIVVAVVLVVLTLLLSQCGRAAEVGTYAPLQPADNGAWYDHAQSGTGFEFISYEQAGKQFSLVAFYGGRVGATPIWFTAQVPWQRAQTGGDLLLTARAFGDVSGDFSAGTVVGHVSLYMAGNTCDEITADVNLTNDSPTGAVELHYSLHPLLQPQRADCYTCPIVESSPASPGC